MKTTLLDVRLNRRLTQQELADRAGIARSALSTYERGLHQPGITAARHIADALGVALDELWPKGGKRS